LDTIFNSLKEDTVNDDLSQKEIIDAISKQSIDIEIFTYSRICENKKI